MMIVCSCNCITTDMIKNVVTYVTYPSEKMVLNMLNWEPQCAICGKVLISEIRKAFEEINNQSL